MKSCEQRTSGACGLWILCVCLMMSQISPLYFQMSRSKEDSMDDQWMGIYLVARLNKVLLHIFVLPWRNADSLRGCCCCYPKKDLNNPTLKCSSPSLLFKWCKNIIIVASSCKNTEVLETAFGLTGFSYDSASAVLASIQFPLR